MTLYLTSLSVPLEVVQAAVWERDPMVAKDRGYAIKTWMAGLPAGLQLRPWVDLPSVSGTTPARLVRLLGWRTEPPDTAALPDKVFLAVREVDLREGEVISLTAIVLPRARSHDIGPDGRDHRRCFSYAEGWLSPEMAFTTWMETQLMGLSEVLTVQSLKVADAGEGVAWRKVARGVVKVVQRETVHRAEVSLTAKVGHPGRFMAWLAQGCGPQKAFGFGGFFPC